MLMSTRTHSVSERIHKDQDPYANKLDHRLQGDPSGSSLPSVDIKTKVAFQNRFDINRRMGTSRWVTLHKELRLRHVLACMMAASTLHPTICICMVAPAAVIMRCTSESTLARSSPPSSTLCRFIMMAIT